MVTRNIIIGRLSIVCFSIVVQYVSCCSETINLSQDLPSTFITSPNFGTNQLYPLKINCKWSVKASNDTSIFLVIHSFDLEYNPYCSWDYVSIQDGVCGTSGYKYCGTIIPPTFEANSGHLCLEFQSDVVIAKKGFNASVSISKPVIEDPVSTIPMAPCQSTPYIINSTTFINSPNFQLQQNYPNNAHCEWIILPDQKSVRIQFKAFNVENHPFCSYDSLKFYNGSTKTSSVLSTYCGTELPKPLIINSTALIIFSSDFIVPKSGFKALIKFPDETNSDTTMPPLVSTTVDMIASITSTTTKLKIPEEVPNFHTNLVMTILTSTQQILSLPASTKSIFNPTTSSPSNVGPTGSKSSTSKLSTSTTVQEVVTDASTSQSTANPASTLPPLSTSQIPSGPVTYEMCSQSVVQLSEDVFVQSPNYGYLQQYPLNMNCMLVFNTAIGMIITVDFKTMDVENHYSCKWDKVIVYDGNTFSYPILDTICGQKKPMLNSTGNSLTIQFISDHMVRRKGFKAVVGAIENTYLPGVTSSGLSATATTSSTNAILISANSLVSTTSSPPSLTSSQISSTISPALSSNSTVTPTSESVPPTSSSKSSISSSASTSTSGTSTSSSVTPTSSPSTSISSSGTSTSSSGTLTSASVSSSLLSISSPTTSTSSSGTSTSSSVTLTGSSVTSTSSSVTSTSSSPSPTSSSPSPTSSSPSPTSSSPSPTSSSPSPTSSSPSPTSSSPSPTSSSPSPTSSSPSPTSSSPSPTSSSPSPTSSSPSPTSSSPSPTSSSLLSTSSPTTSTSSSTQSTSSPTTSINSPATSTSLQVTSTSSPVTPTSPSTTPKRSSVTSTSSTDKSPSSMAPTSSSGTTTGSSSPSTSSSATSPASSSTTSPTSPTYPQSLTSPAKPVSLPQSDSPPTEGPVSICDQTHLNINNTFSLVSPNYGQGQQYPLNVDCGLSISTYSNQYFSITFKDFELEVHSNCNWDYLVVYDGDKANGTKLGKFCGSLHNHTIESATNQLFLKFYSDSVVPKAGFRAIIMVKVSKVTETTQGSITTTTESSASSTASTTEILTTTYPHVDILACAGIPMVLTTSPSAIESPGYAESENYTNEIDCQWAIEAPVDKIIQLSFVSFDVEHKELCSWDSLSVYDGATGSPNLLIGSYCGNTKPSNITSTGSSLYIKFTTDRAVGKKGFKIDVAFINSTNVAPNDCDFDWLPCSSNGNCIPKEWFCDGEQDCFDNEDENNCDNCKLDEISCHGGSCLPQYQRCDGIPQCTDAEDEDDCSSILNDGRLLIMKSSKWFPVCHDDTWSDDSAHIACASLGSTGYISFGSQSTTEKTYAVASASLVYTGTSFSKQFSLSSSCASGQIVTVQCQEKICGTVSESIPQAFIVGGSQSAVGEWPWTVAVMSGDKHICGGTIISEQWILTAGHCISGIQQSPQTTSIIAGATNLKANDVQYRKVSEMILHPQYNFISSADLGLMRLRQPLVFSSTIRPLCLPTRLHTWSPSLPCYIAGWGATNLEDAALQETADDLHHAKVKVWPKSKCESAYPNKIKDSMVCAGYESGHIDACKGDSGGPLMCKVGSENYWVFVGITSWGEGCGGINKPGVYTRVDYYRKWVQQQTQRTDKTIDCNFETPNICGYMDQSNSTLMWARRSGGLNDPPRPLTDVTFKSQQGSFLYAFIPHEERGNSAKLVSPALDLTGENCLTFWFNFHGDIDVVFTVYGIQSDNTTVSLVQFSKIPLDWRHAEVDLTTDIRDILFHVQSNLKYDGGVALDDINISNTSCVGVTKLKCNFDGGTLCNYQQAEDDSDDWQIKVHLLSDTSSRSATTQLDHYLEVNGTNRFPGTLVKLLSPALNSTVPKCLSFKYKISPMFSHTLSVCTVTKYDGNTYSNCHYWEKSSSINNTWTVAHAQIPPVYQPFQIGFQAKRGSLSGIVAVDDITRIDGNCS